MGNRVFVCFLVFLCFSWFRGFVVSWFCRFVVSGGSSGVTCRHGQQRFSDTGIGFAALSDMGNRFASHADMGNRFAERVSWGARTPAFQVRLCGVRFAAGALPALSGQGKHETGRVDSPGAGCLVGPVQKTPFFGRFREVFFWLSMYSEALTPALRSHLRAGCTQQVWEGGSASRER